MARLIDADRLLRDPYFREDRYPCSGLIRMAVGEQPTVDAVPVVHGRCKWCNGDYHTKIMATAIRYHTNGNMDGYEMKVNYCPNCGADMRERSEGE